jgi:hypothetical protein
MASIPTNRAIDKLRKAANLEPIKKNVELNDGTDFEFWHTPLTMAEREKAQKNANSEDATAFALQLLIQKALDENGQKLFAVGDTAELKTSVRDSDLQKLMLGVLQTEGEGLDPKSA